MTPDEFKIFGRQSVDWVARYLEEIRSYPVLPAVAPGELTASLPAHGPERGEDMDVILRDFEQLIVPALTHWNHPRFHAYFSISASPPGILGELLTAAINGNGMLWKSSPAITELEQVTLGWLRSWMGLPESFFGMINDTASISTLHAIAAAREAADPEIRRTGYRGGMTLYTSEHAHSSVEKGAIALGIGQDYVRKVPVDAEFRMRAEELARMMAADEAAGLKPFCVVPTIGTTSTTSIDPVPAVVDVAEKYGAWVHVDASYAGVTAILPEMRSVLAGVERADSLVVNPHKWLFTPIDISVLYTRRPDTLRNAFALVPEYLRTAEDPNALNYMDYGVALGRRFRSLKFWFVLRYYGREGLAELIRSHIRYAQSLAQLIRESPDWELCAPTPFSLVCFRLRGSDERNRQLLERINASGHAFLSHTVLRGQFVLRWAIGNIATTWDDIESTWKRLEELRDGLHPGH